MFGRIAEYFKYGALKPRGVMWAMEKAYFTARRKFPFKKGPVYLRLTFESRYPDKSDDEIVQMVNKCKNLDDAIEEAIRTDFGRGIAWDFVSKVLKYLPKCSSCRKYRALSPKGSRCYGCRHFGSVRVCPKCRLYWARSESFCNQCGGKLVPFIIAEDELSSGDEKQAISGPRKGTTKELSEALFYATFKGVLELGKQLVNTSVGNEINNILIMRKEARCELWIYCMYPFDLMVQHQFSSRAPEIRELFCKAVAEGLLEDLTFHAPEEIAKRQFLSTFRQMAETRFAQYKLADRVAESSTGLGTIALLNIAAARELSMDKPMDAIAALGDYFPGARKLFADFNYQII